MRGDPPGGCFGQRVDRLMRACGWKHTEADRAFGFAGNPSYSPVERVRIGGHADSRFVRRLRALEELYRIEIERLDAWEAGDDKRVRELSLVLGARALRRQAALETSGAVSAAGAAGDAPGGVPVVLRVSPKGRVVARESVESWVARHAVAGSRETSDGQAIEGKAEKAPACR